MEIVCQREIVCQQKMFRGNPITWILCVCIGFYMEINVTWLGPINDIFYEARAQTCLIQFIDL